jgi:hypothetical protein
MKNFNTIRILLWLMAFLLIFSNLALPQTREYRIHDRGMLHETVYNTGTIARGYQYGPAGEQTDVPLMEWPSRSRTVIDGIKYSGQHNTVGAGIYVSANIKGNPGWDNRLFAVCGAAGTTTPELPLGVWSFPILLEEIENFPIIVGADGQGVLNPNYNPDEAEEIIIAKWATPVGITVTRTSRSWSYPNFDDMIIYEYGFEYTGDTDGRPETIELTEPLADVLIQFSYTMTPSMLGLQRNYGSFNIDYFSRADHMSFYDFDYWLYFPMALRTGAPDEATGYLAAHPEPNKDLFRLFSETGLNGGGLLSPQAPGYCILKYDTNHLAIVEPLNPDLNESEAAIILSTDANGEYFELDENKHIKQPWNIKTGTANLRASKVMSNCMTMVERWGGKWSDNFTATYGAPNEYGEITPDGSRWRGRGYMTPTSAYNGASCITGFGPYTLKLGDKIEFAVAEVIGYGASHTKKLMTKEPYTTAPSWNKKVVIDGETMTEHYLDDYGYPDYINSDVITVTQTAHKAFEAYLGKIIEFDTLKQGPAEKAMWPESNPLPSENPDKYKIPIPVPAPVTIVKNTPRATIEVTWNHAAEEFTHPRLTGTIEGYNIYRSNAGMGPWTLLKSIEVGATNNQGLYYYEDDDENFRLGDSRYYAVTSVDNFGRESAKTNITFHTKNVAAVEQLDKVYAVPNPFVSKSGFTGLGMEDAVGFYGLPEKCTIKIYSYAGQLVETIKHDADKFSTAWFQITRNRQDIASGVYVYVVETPEGDRTTGKLIVIK